MNLHILTPNPAYSRADGVNIGKEAHGVTMKALHVLEARLNKLLQRKSEILNCIKQLKHDINHNRRMRLQTDIQHAKYEDRLAELRAHIFDFLAESTAVVEDRDRTLEKKDNLERINMEEQKAFQDEYETMGKFIKEQNNSLEDALIRERRRDGMEKKGILDPSIADRRQGELTLEEELKIALEVGDLTDKVMFEENSLFGTQEKINNYEMMFEQLKKMTGAESLEDVITTYVTQEEEMFSLYNFTQTVNAEIDTVLESTSQIENSISAYKLEQQEQESQRRGVLDELQSKLQAQLKAIRECEEENKLQQECVSQISKKVSSVFFKLQCDQMDSKGSSSNPGKSGKSSSTARPESKIALLTSQGVSESNVLDYMGCIEQRAVDIIAEYIRYSRHIGQVASNPNTPGAATAAIGPRSPTPGPSTPMQWPMESMVDIADFNEEELLAEGPGEEDNKPVDLNAYLDRMKKKLGFTQSKESKDIMLLTRSISKKSFAP